MMVDLSIIILSFNTEKLTLKCVSSVLDQYRDYINKDIELVMVDNASTDQTIQSLKKIREIKTVKNKENFGFSKGNNIGAKNSKGKYVLFLNSDTRVEDQGFLSMIRFLEENKRVGILGAKLTNPDGSVQKSAGNFYNLFNLTLTLLGLERFGFVRKLPKKTERVDWVSGGSLMIRRELFLRLGGFDEKIFMYVEDMEFCFRAFKKGFLTFYYPQIRLIHEERGSGNKEFAVLNIYRGILYFYKKHKAGQYFIARIFLSIKALIAYFLGVFTNNSYLKKTYSSALRIAI